MKTVTVYDSVPERWPDDARYILAYVDGRYTHRNYAQAKKLRPHATIIGCTTEGRKGVRVADVERGDLTPRAGLLWAHHEVCQGRRPVLYCGHATREHIVRLSHELELGVVGIRWWLADWDGDATIPSGYAAHQYRSRADWDESVARPGVITPYSAG